MGSRFSDSYKEGIAKANQGLDVSGLVFVNKSERLKVLRELDLRVGRNTANQHCLCMTQTTLHTR